MIKIGHIGLGRLGLQHAKNLSQKIRGIKLEALCDLDEKKLKETANMLGVTRVYTNFEDMVVDSSLDAISISSPSAFHCKQIELALKSGKHVFCEKPMGVTVEECKEVEKVVEANPNKVFMLGFMRRFDSSYASAKAMVDAGEIGNVFMIRSYSQDPISAIEGAIAYGPHSGGEFLDMAVHDIDLARWFLKAEPKQVWAIGGCYEFEEFKNWNDADNATCLMKFEDDKMAFLLAGRTAPHGYNVETEIMGTRGILRIASVPQKNMIEILGADGVVKKCSQNFLERFEDAYLKEVEEFVACILENRKPEITVYDGTKATNIAYKCKESFEKGILVDI